MQIARNIARACGYNDNRVALEVLVPRTAQGAHHAVRGTTAAYVLEKLIAAGRVSRKEIARILAEIGPEIRRLEARLAQLREGLPSAAAVLTSGRAVRGGKRRKSSAGKALGGTYAGLIRRVPKHQQAEFAEIKSTRGIEAAITALRARKRQP